jgi:AcrR family transcriptional regulator
MSSTAKTKQDVVSEFRTAGILAAARKIFATRGFNDATVDDIATAAGIAKGTVYLYFSGKREIYLAALKEGLLELRGLTQQNMQAADGIRAKLHSFIATRLQYAETNRDFIRIYHSEFGNLTKAPLMDDEFQQLYREQARALEAVLRSAANAGEIRCPRADFTAFIIYDMVRGAMTQRLLEWSIGGIEDDIEVLDELVWKGIVAS